MESTFIAIGTAFLMLMLLIALLTVVGKLYEIFAPSIKRMLYKIKYGDPIEPYRIDKLPDTWRYNPEIFGDNRSLFR